MAVAAGFEPAVGGYPTNAFEAFTFGRSDTPPSTRIEQTAVCVQIRGVQIPRRVDGRVAAAGGRLANRNLGAFLQIVGQNRPQTDHYLQKCTKTDPKSSFSTEPGLQRRPLTSAQPSARIYARTAKCGTDANPPTPPPTQRPQKPCPPHTPNTQKPPAAHGAQCTARKRAETPASTANRVF